MRTISGSLAPASGEIWLDGQPIGGQAAHRVVARGVALVPEGRRVFGPLTVGDNLELGAYVQLRRRARADVDARRESVLELFPRLRERLDSLATTLSGGEQQMLAIGRALMSNPRLLLLDEPSMGLAPLVIRDIFATIRRLSESGLTILLAEQNARLALRLAERGYILDAGSVVASERCETLRADHKMIKAYIGA